MFSFTMGRPRYAVSAHFHQYHHLPSPKVNQKSLHSTKSSLVAILIIEIEDFAEQPILYQQFASQYPINVPTETEFDH